MLVCETPTSEKRSLVRAEGSSTPLRVREKISGNHRGEQGSAVLALDLVEQPDQPDQPVHTFHRAS
jgi:hypothetical protein